jgi:hypothetical protein
LTDLTVATLTDRPTPKASSTAATEPRGPRARRAGRPPARRRYLIPAASAALGVALVAFVVGIGSGPVPPATGAAKLVPADALLYVHLSTDRSRPAVRQALALARRLPNWPLLSAALTKRSGAPLTAPWLGREAAFALLNTSGSTAGSLIVLDVRNRARAESYLAGAGALPDGSYDRATLLRERGGTELAFARHYLLLGQPASVRAALDVATGRGSSLATDSTYRQASSGEPADRVLDAYASVGGVRRVLAPRRGLLGALGVLLDQPALSGVTVSASAVPGALRVRLHEALDAGLARTLAPAERFSPTLANVMPSGSTLLLDVHGLARSARRILATLATAGIGGRVGPLLSRLGSALAAQGVDIPQILSIFSGETAVAITPGISGHGAARAPALVIVARTAHPNATSGLLAGLEAPLAQLFAPPSSGGGQAPEFGDLQVAGVTVHQMALGPGLQLDYAVFRGLVVVSTSVRAIAGVARHSASLTGAPGYRATLAGTPDRVTSLLFFNFNQLLSLGEQAGLTRSAQTAALRPDLEKIRSVGLVSTRGESDSTAELLLQIP